MALSHPSEWTKGHVTSLTRSRSSLEQTLGIYLVLCILIVDKGSFCKAL